MFDEPTDMYRFRFDGGLAAGGELNFYELSRSQYAAARLLYTLVRYQESGRVVARLTERTIADIRVRTPDRGSFIYDAFLYLSASGTMAAAAIPVPLSALLAMVLDRVLPNSADYQFIKAEASLELRRLERRRTELSRKERRRLELVREIQQDKEVSKEDLIELATELKEEYQLLPDAAQEKIQTFELAESDLRDEVAREEIMRPYEVSLGRIDGEDRRRLFSRSRPLIAEVGLPLRTSAKELDVSVGLAPKRIGWLNSERAAEIAETEPDEALDELRGQVIQYNRVTGYGKFRLEDDETALNEYGKEVSFRILKPMQSNINNVVIDAMKEKSVIGEFMVNRDKEGRPKSMLLISLKSANDN